MEKRLATLFDGTNKTQIEGPRPLRKLINKLKKASTPIVPQAERFAQSAQSADESGASALPYSLYPAGWTAQADFL
jgi:hypothetical protein